MRSIPTPPSPRHRAIDRLLAEYSESHRNETNQLIHWLAVPAIFWCVLALISYVPFPAGLKAFAGLDWALLVVVAGTLYYARLSLPLAAGMAMFSGVCPAMARLEGAGPWPLWQVALGVFAIAWVLQFIGHAVEGKRPSFFTDLRFLLIGPAWLMSSVFGKLGLRY